MFAAVSNLDVSWPDPSLSGNDQLQKYIQASNQYIYPMTTTNDAATLSSFTNASYAYIDLCISSNGIVAISPYFGTNLDFYNINTGAQTSGTSATRMVSVTYSQYDNKFYYGAQGPTPAQGIYTLSAAATGSALSAIISGSSGRQFITIDGTTGWITPTNASTSKVLRLDIPTGIVSAVGQDISSGATMGTATVAPNGLVCFGTEGTTCRYYEPSTDTTGTFTGTVAADSTYNWALGRDGYLYSVPRYINTSVYRLDPYKKSISTVFTGSPYTGSYKRGMWVATDGRICTIQAANQMVAYDPITNTAATLPFTFTYNNNFMHQGATYFDGSMYFLNATNQLIRVNNVNTRNLFNTAYQGNNAKRGGAN